MTDLSTSPLQPGALEDSGTNHFPYRMYIEVVPTQGKGRRFEYWRDLQKIAETTEDLLVADGQNIATPVAYTPQFAQVPARLTLIGFVSRSALLRPNASPTTEASRPNIIHSGTVPGEKTSLRKGPMGGDLAQGQDPTAQVDAMVMALKEDIETVLGSSVMSDAFTDLSFSIFFIELNGVKYGSMPNKKAFRSFPR